MFAGGALAVVVVSDHDPWDTGGLVFARNVWHTASRACRPVANVVHLFVFRVESGDKEVVGDVVQVAAEFEPRSCRRNVIGCALALDLDQDLAVFHLFAVPLVKGRQELESLTGGFDVDFARVRNRWFALF